MASSFETRLDPSLWGGAAQPDSTLDWPPPAPPAPAPDPAPQPAPTPAPKPAPAAKGGRFRLKLGPEVEQDEELVTPEKVKSWGSSLAFHLIVLALLCIPFLTGRDKSPRSFEAGLPAGDPRGSDLGQLLTGGDGMDEPLATPLLEAEKTIEPPGLTLTDLSAIKPEATIEPKLSRGSASGGGVALTGTGQAGSGDGFGVAKFGLGGTEMVNNVSVKVGNPQFTLIWDTNVDLDLHVQEPGGSHISFEYRNGRQGGELDVDDVDGHGPENIYWGGGLNKGNGPAGEYKWFVHYYGGAESQFGRDIHRTPTRWKVRLKYNGTYKVFEGVLRATGQQSKVETFKIPKSEGVADPKADRPLRDGEVARFENPPAQEVGSRGFNGGSFDAQGVPDEAPNARPAETKAAPATDATAKAAPRAEPPARPSGPPRDELNWVIVKPEGVAFEVRMPDAPTEETRSAPNDDSSAQVRTWSVSRIEGAYTVAVTDLGVEKAKAEPKALLESEARAEVLGVGGTNARLKPAEIVNNVPMVEVEADLPDRVVAGGGTVRFKLFLVGKVLYRASVMGTKDFVDKSDARRFLESFKVAGEK